MNTHTKRHYPALETLKKRLSSILAEVEEAQEALEALPAQIACAEPSLCGRLVPVTPPRAHVTPTPEQAAEFARQLAENSAPEQGRDPLATRAPGYDPTFTPNPENFGQLN